MNRLLISVLTFWLLAISSWARPTPIESLKLTGPANGGWFNFTNLNAVVASNMTVTGDLTVSGTNISMLISNVIISVVDGSNAWAWVQANSNEVPFLHAANYFTELNVFSNNIQIGAVQDTNYNSMLRVYVPSNSYTGPNDFGQGLVIDGAIEADKELTWLSEGVLKWGWYTYRNTEADYLSLFNYESQLDMLMFYRTGKMGLNTPSDYPNYHTQFIGTGLNDAELDTTSPYERYYKLFYRLTITIEGVPDVFKVETSLDGDTWSDEGSFLVDNLAPVAIGNGLRIIWSESIGHTLGDRWFFVGNPQPPSATYEVRAPIIPEVSFQTNMNVASYDDVTWNINNYDADTDQEILTTETNSATYFGFLVPVDNMYFDISQAATNLTLVMEYWNGNVWHEMNGGQRFADGTANMTMSGSVFFDHSLMSDWTKTNLTVDSYVDEYYWIRMRSSTAPTCSLKVEAVMIHGKYRFAVYNAFNDSFPVFSINADASLNIGTTRVTESSMQSLFAGLPVTYESYTNTISLSNSWYNSSAFEIVDIDTQRWNQAALDVSAESNRAKFAEATIQTQVTAVVSNTTGIVYTNGDTTISSDVAFTGDIPTHNGQPLSIAGEPPLYDGIYTMPTAVFDGTNSVAIGAGVFSLYTNSSYGGRLIQASIPATNLTITTTNAFTFVRASYNSGNPIYDLVATPALINNSSEVQVFNLFLNVSDDERDLYISGNGAFGRGSISKTENRFVSIDGYKRHLGLALSAGTGLDFNLTGGYVWYGLDYINTPPMSSTNDVDVWIHSNEVWTTIETNQMMNGYYDDGSNIVAATPGKYTINWVYVTPHAVNGNPNEFFVVLGDTEYENLALALAAQPTDVPSYISFNSLLVGLLATGSDSNTIEGVVSAFQSTFQGVVINDHNNLAGLQGSAPFIHLSTEEFNDLNDVIGLTDTWNTASSWIIINSNDVASVIAETSKWNQASIDASSATQRLTIVESGTSRWNQAVVASTNATNRIDIVEASTSRWNLAASQGLQNILNNGAIATNQSMQVGEWALGEAVTFPAIYSPSNSGMVLSASPRLADVAKWCSIYLYPTGTPIIVFNTGISATNGILRLQVANVTKLEIDKDAVNYFAPIDMSAGVPLTTPDAGHARLYVDDTTGLEQMYMIDSGGNNIRLGRDTGFTLYNAETNTLQVGEPVYVFTNTAGTAAYMKRAQANSWSTMPCARIVSAVGGIPSGAKGRTMRLGRMEATMDTSAWEVGNKLYVSPTGGLTNVEPTGTNISQFVAQVLTKATNGYITVDTWKPDTIGTMTPSTIDAATLGGYTAHQLSVQGATYYAWGSLAGEFTNPPSLMAKLLSPSDQGVVTSQVTGAGVTNGARVGYACIKSDELPAYLEGKQDVHLQISRNGDASERTIRIHRDVYESDQTTLVDSIIGDTKAVPTTKSDITFALAPVDSIIINGSGRLVVYYFELMSGWTGTETINVLTQDGELTYISFASAPGLYISQEEFNSVVIANTNYWTTAYAWVNANSNDIGYVFSKTSNWNNAWAYIVANSNSIAYMFNQSNSWNTAYTWVNTYSNQAADVFSKTGNWNTAYTWVNANSNGLVNTSNWNSAYTHATNSGAQITNVFNNMIATYPTSNWNQAYTWVSANSNKVTAAITNNQQGVTLQGTFVGNFSVTTSQFKAGLYTNVTIIAAARVFPMTNTILAASGGILYSNSLSRWYPNTTNKIIEFTGSLDIPAISNGDTIGLYLYKNNALYTTLFAMRSGNASDTATTTWKFIETVNTSTGDYYEVWINMSNTYTTRGAGSNNWWYARTY